MANTNFVDESTTIVASWLNDQNDATYSAIGSGAPNYTAPKTPTDVLNNLGLTAPTGLALIGTSSGNNAQVEMNLKPQIFANAAAVRAYTAVGGVNYAQIVVNGTDGGSFRRDSSDTTSAEDGGAYCGTIIRPADYATNGVCKRGSYGYYASSFGATGNGITDNRTSLLAADTAAGAAGVILQKGTYAVASNLTITNPLTFNPGAKLKPASGVTITLSSVPIAGLYSIFDLSAGGKIAFAGSPVFNAEWFWDGSSDWGPTFNKIDALALRGTLKLSQFYKHQTPIKFSSNIGIVGNGPNVSGFWEDVGSTNIAVQIGDKTTSVTSRVSYATITGWSVVGSTQCVNALYMYRPTSCDIDNIVCYAKSTSYCIQIEGMIGCRVGSISVDELLNLPAGVPGTSATSQPYRGTNITYATRSDAVVVPPSANSIQMLLNRVCSDRGLNIAPNNGATLGGNTIQQVYVESNGAGGLQFSGCYGLTVGGIWSESNLGYDYYYQCSNCSFNYEGSQALVEVYLSQCLQTSVSGRTKAVQVTNNCTGTVYDRLRVDDYGTNPPTYLPGPFTTSNLLDLGVYSEFSTGIVVATTYPGPRAPNGNVRVYGGNPITNSVVPNYLGELLRDSFNNKFYISNATTAGAWVLLTST